MALSTLGKTFQYLFEDELSLPNSQALDKAAYEAQASVTKQALIARVLASVLGVSITCAFTYFGIKWAVKAMDPTSKEKDASKQRAAALLKKIGVENVQLNDYELCMASNLIDPLSMTIEWSDIGGLESVIGEMQQTIILPFTQPHLFKSSTLLQPPKGVLLYGPPGCGKTMIAKATAKAAGARFLNLQLSSLFDKWYGESQKRVDALFSLASKLQPCIIFIDEIDSFLRSRSGSDHESTGMIKTQFMSWWDGISTDSDCRVLVMAATNRPQDVDAAILRRMPATFNVTYPGKAQRVEILALILSTEQVDDDVDIDEIAEKTHQFSGSDLKELCRVAALNTVTDYLSKHRTYEPSSQFSGLRRIRMQDFVSALERLNKAKLNTTQQFLGGFS